ncbi:probable protein disulfide-isomerase ER-60 [Dendronephthya gigantea]|uniref:probable protein disulfide-isomerase ER-60 n=1 Tax=Dendronephthya gigantea TaxID=151771 RepID=UPI00106D885E|nr:probable protein disulfide-isomerase ER-60 [Dendronephthya gigantea]
MQYSVFLVLLASATVYCDSVFQLTDNDFDQYIKDKEAMLVEFYAPWCSDCKRLEPKYESAAAILGAKKKFVLAKIDCFGSGMATCRKYGVRSWPQVKLFKYGKYEGEYYGAEDAYAIAAFMDGLVSQPESQPVVQDAQAYNQAQYSAQAPAAPAPFYNTAG